MWDDEWVGVTPEDMRRIVAGNRAALGLPPQEADGSVTHDYTRRYWGHDYSVQRVDDGGTRLWASGWGEGIREGDHLVLPNGEATTRYRVKAIRYEPDPRDMWWADLVFAPREEGEG